MRLSQLTVFAFAATLFAMLSVCSLAAQEKELSAKTLETMKGHVASLHASSRPAEKEEVPLKLVTTPILRYSDPGGITTDASIWVWGHKGRPSIVAGIFFLTQEGREPKWSCELLSLADGGVTVRSDAGWKWTPDKGALKWLALEDPPADSARQRLKQMKEIAARYEITTFEGASKSELRLMVQPLHRYADEERGLIDGAIFAYAAGTNPETLLVVECRKAGESSAWHAAFVRFGANRCQARKGETEVWECPAIQGWESSEPYFSRFGPAQEVFEPAGPK